MSPVELTDVRGGGEEEMGKEPNNMTARKPGPLQYSTKNTLCVQKFIFGDGERV